MKTIISLLLVSLIWFPVSLISQKLDKQNTYQITGKSKRGSLGHVELDKPNGEYFLTYIVKENNKMAKFQIYHFDTDFNFVKMDEEIIEFTTAKNKYKWFNYSGEEYFVEGVFVEKNLTGTLVLKQKRIQYKYDWLFLGYHKDVDVLQKIKPKTDDGRKFFYIGHSEDEMTGEVLILAGVKDQVKKGADPYLHTRRLVAMKYNNELERTAELEFTFEYPQHMAFSRTLAPINEDYGIKSIAFVFAPMGGSGMGKYQDPDKTNYSFVHIDRDMKLLDRISFKSPSSYWLINELIHDQGTGSIYLYGPAASGKDKYYNVSTTQKFNSAQLLKVANHKIDYFSETGLDEFEAKLKSPPSQKKAIAYTGKKFVIANYHISTHGDFFVTGQNFTKGKTGNQYKDAIAFHFDNNGVLKSQYGLDVLENNSDSKAYGTPQKFFEQANGDKIFWLFQEIKGIAYNSKLLTYPRMGHITKSTGEVSDFEVFGEIGKDKYYLDTQFPYLETDIGNTLVFFGSDKPGKEIWFARILLE